MKNINRCMASIMLFLMLVMSPVGCRSQNKTDRSHFTHVWLPVRYAGSVITKVGDYKLPYPIKLPKNLMPLGNKSLVSMAKSLDMDNSNKKISVFIVRFYFDPKQEKEARSWAQSLKNYKLWIAEKDIRGKVFYNFYPYPNGWAYLLTARTTYGDIAYNFKSQPSYSKEDALKNTAGLPGADKYVRAMWEKGSPIIGIRKFICLWVMQRKSL